MLHVEQQVVVFVRKNDMARRAGKRSFARALEINAMAVREVQAIVADRPSYFCPSTILINVHNVHAGPGAGVIQRVRERHRRDADASQDPRARCSSRSGEGGTGRTHPLDPHLAPRHGRGRGRGHDHWNATLQRGKPFMQSARTAASCTGAFAHVRQTHHCYAPAVSTPHHKTISLERPMPRPGTPLLAPCPPQDSWEPPPLLEPRCAA
jgi:hypothetical protein